MKSAVTPAISATTVLVALFAISIGSVVNAQGVLLPDGASNDFVLPRHLHHVRPRPVDPPISYRICELAIASSIEGQVATTQISQTFENTGARQIQASFCFPLPHDAAVDRMTFLVEGKEYEAELLDAKKARAIYEGYVRRNQDPALLEWIGQGMFKTSVFPIPAGAKRTVQIRYTQLIRQDSGVNDFVVPLATARFTDAPIETVSFRATIATREKLKNIYSPTHDIQVDRSGDNQAIVTVSMNQIIPANDLRIMYSTDAQGVGASLISYWPTGESRDGYFTLLATPEVVSPSKQAQRKNVIFVVDRSGSMNGKKFEQAREAAKFVLNNLNESDTFNLIAYDTEVQAFRPELQRYTPESHREATAFVDGLFAGGSTNIDGALETAFGMIQDSSVPTYIVFLTDGLPTAGVQNEAQIADNAKKRNRYGARLISFGVGFDVNSRLLDRLTRENNGQGQYVRPDENIEDHVSRLYEKISAPVLANVKIEFDFENPTDRSPSINRLYPAHDFDLFAGQQLILVGRYNATGNATMRITGTVEDELQTFEYHVTFAKPTTSTQYAFAARLWAARRIGEIIDLIDLNGRNEELVDELVRLSTEHGILTPYTAFLADDMAAPDQFSNRAMNNAMAADQLGMLQESGGASGFAQRGFKQSLKSIQNAAPPSAAGQAGVGGRGIGGGGGGYSFGAPAQGGNVPADAPGDGAMGRDAVRYAGNQAAYLKGNTLIAANAADVNLEEDSNAIIGIKRFSEEYFALLDSTTPEENQLLALQRADEVMIVRLQGNVYRVE